jgi:hypothetical protein
VCAYEIFPAFNKGIGMVSVCVCACVFLFVCAFVALKVVVGVSKSMTPNDRFDRVGIYV